MRQGESVVQVSRAKSSQIWRKLSPLCQEFSSLSSLIAVDRLIATQGHFSTVSSHKTFADSKLRKGFRDTASAAQMPVGIRRSNAAIVRDDFASTNRRTTFSVGRSMPTFTSINRCFHPHWVYPSGNQASALPQLSTEIDVRVSAKVCEPPG